MKLHCWSGGGELSAKWQKLLCFQWLSAGAGVLVVGCAGTIPADPSKMTADQLNAMAKDKSASAACTIVNSPWGVGRTIWVQLDKSTFKEGTVSVNAECGVAITSATPAKSASAP